MLVLLFLLDKVSLFFLVLVLIVLVLGYLNSREIKIKNNKDFLYWFKIEILSKVREFEIVF